jgi:hypothetical protein
VVAQYAPELNDIESSGTISRPTIWLTHTFADNEALDRAIHAAVEALDNERRRHPFGKRRISA